MALIIPSPLWSFVVGCCKVDLKGNFTKSGLALSEAPQFSIYSCSNCLCARAQFNVLHFLFIFFILMFIEVYLYNVKTGTNFK